MVINVDDDAGDDGDDDDGDDDDNDDDDGDDDDGDDDGGDDEYEDGDGDDEDGSDEEGENGDGEDAGDGDDADDDDEEEEERKRMMLMLMLMFMLRRRRKMMMLRRRMLRRKTDPKTGKHTSCEPVQPKCRRTLHKSQSVWKIRGKMAADTSGDIVLCEPAQSKCTWTKCNSHFVRKIYMKNDRGHLQGHRFVRACAGEMHMDMSQEAFCAVIYRENAGPVPFCASLRSRNAHGHVTRGILCGNLHPIPPRLNTGPELLP